MDRHRFHFLDGLRGIAAIAVVIYHWTLTLGVVTCFSDATIAVDVFFCLSGFVIAHAYHDRLLAGMTVKEFAVKRIIRLYPMFLIGWLIGVVILLIAHERGYAVFRAGDFAVMAALNMAYLPYFGNVSYFDFHKIVTHGIFPVNPPFWSLFFEMVANFVYVLWLRCCGGRIAVLIAIAVVAVVGEWYCVWAYGVTPGWGRPNFIGGFGRVLYEFILGVLIFRYRAWLDYLPLLPPWVIAALVLEVFCDANDVSPFFHQWNWLIWSVKATILVPFLVALGARVTTGGRDIPPRIGESLGALSYPLYCIHFPFILLASAYCMLTLKHHELAETVFLASAIVITIYIAWRLEQRVEAPLRRWLSGLAKRDPDPSVGTDGGR